MASGKNIMRRMRALANAFLVFSLFRDRNETSNDDGHLDSIFIRLNGIKSVSLTKRVVSLGMCV